MAPVFPNNLIRRYTQQFLEEETLKDKVWIRLVSFENLSDHLALYSLLNGSLQPQTRWFSSWRRTQNPKDGDIEMRSSDTDSTLDVDAREELYCVMVSSLQPDPVFKQCWRWYLSYLDSQIKELWSIHLAPTIRDLPPEWNAARPEDWAPIYKVICVIASTIAKGMQGVAGVEISLDNIIEELTIADLLASPMVLDHVRQMVWSLAGPITMLFDPKNAKANSSLLQLRRSASTHTARGRHRGTVITSFIQPASVAQEPFYQMLMQFGTLLPEVRSSSLTGQCNHVLNSTNDSHFYPNYVSFDVLKNVAKLRIEWVNTLNLHLQLDERKRILRLYRFPAFCRLLYADGPNGGEPNGKKSFLCQLFNHYKASRMQGQPQERDSLTFFDFLRDMILSYRLLFGMDRKSRKCFRAESENWQRDSLHDGPFSGQRMYEIDPLLWILCTDSGTSPELKKLLNLLDGEEHPLDMRLRTFLSWVAAYCNCKRSLRDTRRRLGVCCGIIARMRGIGGLCGRRGRCC